MDGREVKASGLGPGIFGCVGSNPTPCMIFSPPDTITFLSRHIMKVKSITPLISRPYLSRIDLFGIGILFFLLGNSITEYTTTNTPFLWTPTFWWTIILIVFTIFYFFLQFWNKSFRVFVNYHQVCLHFSFLHSSFSSDLRYKSNPCLR